MKNDKPNIVILTLHDLGKELNCYNPDLPKMENIELLVQNGLVFDNHFTTSPLCSPARSSMQTGRYPHCNGVNNVTHRGFELNEDEKCIPHYLNEIGYHTALIGLQHETNNDLHRLGYKEIWQSENGFNFRPDVLPAAIDFLKREHDNPFMLSIGFRDVHRSFREHYNTPLDPKDMAVPEYLKDCPEIREDLAWFHGMVKGVDGAIKEILDTLKATGLEENTLFIFTTDHGAAFPRAKGTLYDPGIGVTFMAYWPGKIKSATRTQALTSHVDILPTILELLGQPIPEKVQGQSFLKLFTKPEESSRQAIFAEKSWHGNEYDPMRCIRTTKFKYIRNFKEGWLWQVPLDIRKSHTGHIMEDSRKQPRAMTELYDLHTDPGETNNLSGNAEFAETENNLLELLDDWMQKTQDPLPDNDIEWPRTDKAHYFDNKTCPMPELKEF